jgi:D-alanyl-lipoteichoic acid acyltransferase DltB (MBOAT superfamily)
VSFNSILYAAFLFAVCLVSGVLLRHRVLRWIWPWGLSRQAALWVRNAFLLAASYVFYAAWDYRFLSLLAFSTVVDFAVGRALGRTEDPVRRRRLLLTSLVSNLGLLGVFKYFDFFAQSFADLLVRFDFEVEPYLLDVVLPVGISFYTFQTLSYTIDVYRGRIAPERNLVNFATFVAFFPQLVAGPIERAADLLPQFRHTRNVTAHRIESGAFLIFTGLFKKVVIADNVSALADASFALGQPDALQVLVGVYAFAIQIYCDFSGYTDIARGSARWLGFELSRNFDLPYFATGPSDFWRRWHISLSSWLRDYLYIPLGGNRRGTTRTYINLMLTMLLGGLWHGAAWTFVAWGAFHGALLCLYRWLSPRVSQALRFRGVARGVLHWLHIVFFFHVVCLSWLLFRAEDMTEVASRLAALAEPSSDWLESLNALGAWPLAAALGLLLFLVQLAQYTQKTHWVLWRWPMPIRAFAYAAAILVFVWTGEDHEVPFVYFQF